MILRRHFEHLVGLSMSKGSELDKAMWSEAAHHTYQFFEDVTADPRPRITLSNNLYFRISPDKAELISLNAAESISISLSLDALRVVLRSIHLASTSEQIRIVDVEGVKAKIDGRRHVHQRLADKLFGWIWKPAPAASATEPSKHIHIKISGLGSSISTYVERSQLERLNLAKLEAPRPI